MKDKAKAIVEKSNTYIAIAKDDGKYTVVILFSKNDATGVAVLSASQFKRFESMDESENNTYIQDKILFKIHNQKAGYWDIGLILREMPKHSPKICAIEHIKDGDVWSLDFAQMSTVTLVQSIVRTSTGWRIKEVPGIVKLPLHLYKQRTEINRSVNKLLNNLPAGSDLRFRVTGSGKLGLRIKAIINL